MMKKIDKEQIRNILTIRYNPKERVELTPIKWNDFRPNTNDPTGLKTEKLLQNSLLKQLHDISGPLVVSLSSGIDSSLTLSLIRKLFPAEKIIALCGVFEGNDESLQAKKIAKKFDAKFRIIKMPSIFINMPKIISITSRPRWNTYTHIIANEAKKHGTVLITGDGADEIFGGYSFRYSKFLKLLKPKDNWKIKTFNYLECHNRDWVPDQESLFGSNIKFSWNNILQYFKSYFSNPLQPLEQVMLADLNGKLLRDFIPTGNAISKYYNVKQISPFLCPEVANFGIKLPLYQKYDSKSQRGKLLLRKIAKRNNVFHIDEKKGFSPGIWFEWEKVGKHICKSYIMQKNARIFQKKLINYNWVLRAYERVEQDGDIRYLNRLISILALEIWYRLQTKELKTGDLLVK
jgi:asparagine synthase (glutamine-hydrolysing)